MRQLLDVFERHGGPVLAVMRVPREEIGRYGVIAARGLGANVYEVLDLVEKPDPPEAPSDLAIVGRYVLTPDLFPILADTAPDSRGGDPADQRPSHPAGAPAHPIHLLKQNGTSDSLRIMFLSAHPAPIKLSSYHPAIGGR